MRPRSIILFERIVIALMLIATVDLALDWDELLVEQAEAGMQPGVTSAILLLTAALYILLLWLVARRASILAKWVYVVLAVFVVIRSVLWMPETFAYALGFGLLGVCELVLELAALWLLFRPDARRWFEAHRRATGGEILGRS